jgi:hypothetical protein
MPVRLRQRGAGAERQIGVAGHHQPCRAFEVGADDFVAQHAVADIDLAGRRSHDADDLIPDDGPSPTRAWA